jgi:tRNA(adenine34) deaminase
MRLALARPKPPPGKAKFPWGGAVRNGEVVARAHNRGEQLQDPRRTRMLVLREAAAKLHNRRLSDCTLYTTLEPCPMCAGAMVMAKLARVLLRATDERQGCCESVYALASDPSFFWRLRCVGGLCAGMPGAADRLF